MVAGAGAGGALISLVLAATRGMPRGPNEPFTNIALGAMVSSLAVAVGVAFIIGRRISVWRGILVAMPAMAGTALVAVLTTVADQNLGRPGLLALAALCIGAIVFARRVFLAPAPS